MGNAAGSPEVPQGKEAKTASASPGSRKQNKEPKLPMPPGEELEERFGVVLVSCVNFHTEEEPSRKKARNVEHVGNVHVVRTRLSLYQVHKATVEGDIRAPLCWSLMQH